MPVHDWGRVRAGKFHHFHNAWIYRLSDRLNAGILPPGFYAAGEQIIGQIEPDVLTFREEKPSSASLDWRAAASVRSALESPPRVSLTMRAESSAFVRKQDSLSIRSSDGDRLIALMEIVSPGNKGSRHELDRFLTKLSSAIDAGCQLLVIDLHRPGRLDPAGIHGALWDRLSGEVFLPERDRPLTLVSYQSGDPVTAYVELLPIGGELPTMPLFLDEEAYVDVPLEETYQETWRGFPPPWRRELEDREREERAGED